MKLNVTMTVILAISTVLGSTAVDAAYVTPQIGGGQVGMTGAPMLHADILFDGVNLSVHLDDTVATPILRSLAGDDEFDSSQPWAVLNGKAYNFQYAWNPGGFITLPEGAAIWVQRIHHDDGLRIYLRPPAEPAYSEVFISDGDIWKWSGAMTHNVYAVENPTEFEYSATYRIYIGDATTGQALDGYGDVEVTWIWYATPVPEPASIGVLGIAAAMLMRRRNRVA